MDGKHAREDLDGPGDGRHLDTAGLARLTEAFHAWVQEARRPADRDSRRRLWLIYLLLRYTGARLGEVLALNPARDLDLERGTVAFGSGERTREVLLAPEAVRELVLAREDCRAGGLGPWPDILRMDPGHIRRKFGERGAAAGIGRDLSNPSALRRSRAVELLRDGVPLGVVQAVLGHSSANLTAAWQAFSEEDMRWISGQFLRREARRTTSARNSFFGKITHIAAGDVQAFVTLAVPAGYRVSAVVTMDSVDSLRLAPGRLVTAEIKAPLVMVARAGDLPALSAENRLKGVVDAVRLGRVASEALILLGDGTRVCAVITRQSALEMDLRPGEEVYAVFSAFGVILRVE